MPVEIFKPRRIASLPVDARGFPVPWFVSWFDKNGKQCRDGQGEPHFPHIDGRKIVRAARMNICWICGQPLGIHKSFVLGPMCSVNRINPEPPSHLDCATYAVQACPFLSRPRMRRVPVPEGGIKPAGIMIERNPGAAAIWTTRGYRMVREGNGVLFQIEEPESVTWWREGRAATRAEVMEAIVTGLPLLRQNGAPEDWINEQLSRVEQYLPVAA